ncbi:MAG: N-acetyltransferase [Candidatus Izemoplasmatales bacterium]|nr:N-acetyltransferase [Candidatus Izemoplasmatales bacterium]MDY0138142.1 N-acetyltransferase [Candidatus Izemoplasmatales bacterium]
MNIIIRKEEKKDYKTVEQITKEAFYNEKDLEEKGYPAVEPYLVHQLRKKDGNIDLSLVATLNDEVVGHIIYSKAYILTEENNKIDTLIFGPVSVRKNYQNQGIGTRLITESIKIAIDYGYGAIIIFGHPNYYPRFGFVPASNFCISTKEGHNFDAFMALELKKGYLSEKKGKFYASDIFDEEAQHEQILDYYKKH